MSINAAYFQGNDLFITNEWGTTVIPFREKRLTHDNGWMACLPEKSQFTHEFDYGSQFSNITYNSMFYFLEPDDYVCAEVNEYELLYLT